MYVWYTHIPNAAKGKSQNVRAFNEIKINPHPPCIIRPIIELVL
jgi:hypothetical protein